MISILINWFDIGSEVRNFKCWVSLPNSDKSLGHFAKWPCVSSCIMKLTLSEWPYLPVAHLFLLTKFLFKQHLAHLRETKTTIFSVVWEGFLVEILDLYQFWDRFVEFHVWQELLKLKHVSWESKTKDLGLCEDITQDLIKLGRVLETNKVNNECCSVWTQLKNSHTFCFVPFSNLRTPFRINTHTLVTD